MQMSVSIDGVSVQISSQDFPAINFENFNGPLYVGGHPSLSTIGVSKCSITHIVMACVSVFFLVYTPLEGKTYLANISTECSNRVGKRSFLPIFKLTTSTISMIASWE